MSSLQALLLPSKVIELSQELALNVRELCSDTLFIRASNGMWEEGESGGEGRAWGGGRVWGGGRILCVCVWGGGGGRKGAWVVSLRNPVLPEDLRALPEREDWKVHAEEGGIITSLPVLFENLVVEILLSLKEVIVESLPGEPKVCY